MRAAWAAGAAELLFPTAWLLPGVLAKGGVTLMRTELDRAWDSIDCGVPLDSAASGAEALIPDDEVENFTFEHGLAQNVAASVAYATRCAHSGDAQDAIWSWRQVFEVVDRVMNERGDHGMSQGGLPNVALLIPEYLTLIESGWSVTTLRDALRTRADPLSRALTSG